MKFTDKQIEAISQIYIDLGKVMITVLVIGSFVSKGITNLNVGVVVLGVLMAGGLFGFGVYLKGLLGGDQK